MNKQTKKLELDLLEALKKIDYLKDQVDFYKNAYEIQKSIYKMNTINDEVEYSCELIKSQLEDIKLQFSK